jgi:deoxycytidylate deaminase
MPHCTDVGCLVYESKTPNGETEQNCFRTIHAEMNAIAQAAKNGSSIKDGAIYITHTPCIHSLKVLVNTGIKEIFYLKPYKLHTWKNCCATPKSTCTLFNCRVNKKGWEEIFPPLIIPPS